MTEYQCRACGETIIETNDIGTTVECTLCGGVADRTGAWR